MGPAIIAMHCSSIRTVHAVRRNGTCSKHSVLLKYDVEQMQKDTKLSCILKLYIYNYFTYMKFCNKQSWSGDRSPHRDFFGKSETIKSVIEGTFRCC